MGVDFRSEVEFPPDDSGQGFDNIGEVLTVSPLLMEKDVQAAATIVAQSVLTVSRIPRDQSVVPSNNDETTMSFYETDRLARTFTAEHDDQKKIRITVEVLGKFKFDPGRANIAFRVDSAPRLQQEFGWDASKSLDYEYDETWTAGDHELAFTLQPLVPVEQKVNSLDFHVVDIRVQGPMDQQYWLRHGSSIAWSLAT